MATGGADIYGPPVRMKVPAAIFVMEEAHAPELARALGVSRTTMSTALATLEGMIVGTMEDQTRRFRLNRRFRAHAELSAFLEKLSLGDPALLHAIADMRRRPRKKATRREKTESELVGVGAAIAREAQ